MARKLAVAVWHVLSGQQNTEKMPPPASDRWSALLGTGSGLRIGDSHELADTLVVEQTRCTIGADINRQTSVESKGFRVQHLKTCTAGQLNGERHKGGAANKST